MKAERSIRSLVPPSRLSANASARWIRRASLPWIGASAAWDNLTSIRAEIVSYKEQIRANSIALEGVQQERQSESAPCSTF